MCVPLTRGLAGTAGTRRSLTARAAPCSLSKKFTNLPEHARVRVVATFHFIDLWQGEVRCVHARVRRLGLRR